MSAPADHREGLVHSFLSPEAVRLDLPISGPVPRMLAYGIDLICMSMVVFLLIVFLMTSSSIGAAVHHFLSGFVRGAVQHSGDAAAQHRQPANPFGGLVLALFVLVEFAISTCYFIFWEMVTGGRSPGKLIVGLRVVRRTGLPI